MDTKPCNRANHQYTSSPNDVRKAINNENVHCLLPRSCRESFIITLPNTQTKVQIQSAIITLLNNNMPNNSNFILNMEELTTINGEITYSIIFLTLPKDLINNLFLAGIKSANFYVGYSENKEEFPLLNEPPPDEKLAMINNENIKVPYKAVIKLNPK